MRTELLSITTLLSAFLSLFSGIYFFAFLDQRLFGAFFIVTSLFLLILLYLGSRRRYVLVKMGSASISEKVLCHYTREALHNLFPSHKLKCDVIVHRKGKLEILADIPYLSEMKREQKLSEIETLLSASLLKHCGWKGSFIFNVSFS